MKKTLTRALSLFLVLVMMLGVVPFASADEITIEVGETTTIDSGLVLASEETLNWFATGGTLGENVRDGSNTDDTTTTFTSDTAGTYTITCIKKVWNAETSSFDTTDVSFTCTVEVEAPQTKVTNVVFASETYNIKVGESLNLTPSVSPSDATNPALAYSDYDETVISVTPNGTKNADVVGLKVGSTTLKVAATDGSGKYDTCTINVSAPDKTGIAIDGENPVAVGDELTLTAKALPTGAALTENATYTWTVSSGTGAATKKAESTTSSLTIVGASAGTVTVTVSDGTHTSEAFTVTVEEAETCTVTMNPDELTLQQGKTSEALTVVVKDSAGEAVTTGVTTANWKSSDETVATVTAGNKVKASSNKAGTANITCDVLVEGVKVGVATCAVTVKASEIVLECENTSKIVGGSVVLEPTLKIAGVTATDVEYEFTRKSGGTSSNTKVQTSTDKSKASVTSTAAGLVEVEVKVKSYKLNGTKIEDVSNIEPLIVLVRFYNAPTVELTLENGKTRIGLDDDKVFSKVSINEYVNTALTNASFKTIFECQMSEADALQIRTVKFADLSSFAPGQLVDDFDTAITSYLWAFLDQVLFDQVGSRTGTTNFTYELLDDKGLTMLKGYCSIIITGGEGDIHYETTYNKPITLKESDFTSFWSAKKLGSQYTLRYVTFDTTGMTGTLYTDSTKKTQVRSSMRFYITPPTTGDYDLGSVYYVPASNKTAEYIDSFNFTAVDLYGLKPQYGTVTVELNAKSTNITSRGMVFSTTYSKSISDTYTTITGANLGYVIFDLPEAKYGKMYSKLPVSGSYTKVADGTPLKLTDKLWYNSKTATDLKLANAAFVPAAGFSGEVELTYTAYDLYGGNEYKGTLRLNVSTKTASGVFSDVTSRSYSWAADSADFLYYEGTAQGTNGKYNPASNITRRDFMLMLYRAFLADSYGTFTVTSNFPDVPKGTDAYSREIYQAVGVAKYLGIAQGTNDKFNPTSNITRQEAMVLIYRTLDVINRDLNYTAGVNAAYFKDYNKVSSWAATAIIYLVNHGVIQGSNDMIKPTSNITRAEMACILHRVLTY